MSEEEDDSLRSIDKTLKEILRWTRFANISKLKETLEAELGSDEKKRAYENSDGLRGIREIASASGARHDTVYSWWQKWFRMGLVVESTTRKGRMTKIVSLDDVGIKVPRFDTPPVGEAVPAEGREDQESATEIKPATNN